MPIIAVLGAFSNGKTTIKGAERLRFKESDRIESVVNNLRLMGVDITETKDGMIINGSKPHGADLKGYNDHRIVMAFSVAGLFCDGDVRIDDAQSIASIFFAFILTPHVFFLSLLFCSNIAFFIRFSDKIHP